MAPVRAGTPAGPFRGAALHRRGFPRMQGAAVTAKGDGVVLRGFQRRFLAAALAPGVDTAALSIPRGNGKTWLAAHILARALTPGDRLYESGAEYLLCAASIEQARLCFRFVRADLEPTREYRFLDSLQRIGIAHKSSNTRLRVLSSNAKTSMGIVGCPLLVADEPGSWETVGGGLMHDAIQTAMGKPGSPMRAIYIGTLAPARSGWWHDLVNDGTGASTFVQELRGDLSKWDKWGEIRRCNPLVDISPAFRAKLLEERDSAVGDSRLKARFLSFRMNRPSQDESSVLLTVDDWAAVCARPVPEAEGRPIVGVDLGGGRSFSAAVAVYRSGRIDAVACAPGVPAIEAQERRDRVPAGTYRALVDAGTLHVSPGRRVQPIEDLVRMIRPWGPEVIVCDRFRLSELLDAMGNTRVPVVPRVSRWSEASEDIRGLRRLAKDGPLSCVPAVRGLVQAALAVSEVKSDDQGSVRLVKSGSRQQTSRDDVSSALLFAAGALSRTPSRPRRVYLGSV